MKRVIITLLLIASSFLYGRGSLKESGRVAASKEGYYLYYPGGEDPAGVYPRIVEKLNRDLGMNLGLERGGKGEGDLVRIGWNGEKGWETGRALMTLPLYYHTYPDPYITPKGPVFVDSEVALPEGAEIGSLDRDYFDKRGIRQIYLEKIRYAKGLLKGGVLEGVFLEENYELDWEYMRKNILPINVTKKLYIKTPEGEDELRRRIDRYIERELKAFLVEIIPEERQKYYRWKLKLSQAEEEYLKERRRINVHIPLVDYPPYISYTRGEAEGYLVDYLKRVEGILGVGINIVRSKNPLEAVRSGGKDSIDVVIGSRSKYDRKSLLRTGDFYKLKLGVVGRRGAPGIDHKRDLKGKRLAFYGGFFTDEEEAGSGIEYLEVLTESVDEALERVGKGEADYILGDINVIGRSIYKKGLLDKMEVAGYLNEQLIYSIYVEEEELLFKKILDKLMDKMGEHVYSGGEIDTLNPLYVEKDYTPVLYVLLVFMVILFLFLRHFNIMKREIARRERVEIELREKVEAERQLRDNMELISLIGKELTSNLDVWRALEGVGRRVEEMFGEYLFGIIARSRRDDTFYYRSCLGWRGSEECPIPDEVEEVFGSGEGIFSQGPKFFSTGSYALIPLRVEERFIGVMYFEAKRKIKLYEREFLEQMANFISIAVSNSDEAKALEKYAIRQERLRESKQAALSRLNFLGSIGKKMGATFDIYSIGRTVFSYYKKSTKETPFGIAVKDIDTGEIKYEYIYTGERELPGREGNLLKSGIVREVINTGEPIILRGREEHLERQEDLQVTGISAGEVASSLYYPIKFSGEVLGLMVVEGKSRDLIEGVSMGGMDSLVSMLGIALNNSLKAKELERAKTRFEKRSLTDELTRLPNRRAFYEKFLPQWERATEKKRPLGIVIIDLDYFKQVNDSFGHLEGDRVLKRISAILRSYERYGDRSGLFGRYGGDEFIGGFSGYTSRELLEVAEEIRVKAKEIEYSGEIEGHGHLSLSIGVYVGDPCKFKALREFIGEADRAMYSAKKLGRNQTFLLE
ncbi:hypothetical protein PM10SUCC1_10980 [Propionigenium maris DSM 9537]|uniref:GGDEF domain-containing protein n=1 Tax=Propionigenium maris DSM 9537 TaxID=1123000 RepID=A0A9W6GI16_9FUSO|nr:diguanylate cyclase [Propionigenium maris]GLI55584.1 hypothetical protein PM10SUCC1_10980 [Propionigenium maris DSM 9537]